MYPVSSLPLAGPSHSISRNSLDSSKNLPPPISSQPKNSSTKNEYKPQGPLSTRSVFMPSNSKSNLSAYNKSTDGCSTNLNSQAPELPKRTVFTPTSINNLASVSYIPQNTPHLMPTVISPINVTQPPFKMTSSSSSHSLTSTSSIAKHHGSPTMDQQKHEILEKFDLKSSNMVSPTHGIAGDILSSSFKHLDSSAAGKHNYKKFSKQRG